MQNNLEKIILLLILILVVFALALFFGINSTRFYSNLSPQITNLPSYPKTTSPQNTSPQEIPPVQTGTFTKPVSINANFYNNLQPLMRAGDTVSASSLRSNTNSPITVNDPKFQNAINVLESVHLTGINKLIIFSSVEDVRNLINQVPPDINLVGYDLEPGLSPRSDTQNIPLSVQAFANIVHGADKQVGFGPTDAILMNLLNSGQLTTVAKNLDSITLQGQKVLAIGGMTTFQSQVQSLSTQVKSANPQIHFQVQLWIGVDTVNDIIQGFTSIKDQIDQAGIGTNNDINGVQSVLSGLGR